MKIAIINNLYEPLARGGAERVAKTMADSLSRDGEDAIVITTRPYFWRNTGGDFELQKIFRFPSCYFNLSRTPLALRFLWHLYDQFDIITVLRIKKVLLENHVDTVITHNLKGISLFLPLVLRWTGLRHVHFLHDIQLLHPSGLVYKNEELKLDSLWSGLYAAINRNFFRQVDTVIAPSKWIIDQHTERGFFKNARVEAILNPIDEDFFQNSPVIKKSVKFVFLYVGLLEYHKGIDLLLSAFLELTGIEVELWIVGSGSLGKKMNFQEMKNISFLGRKSKGDVVDLMRQADCLVMPSRCYENSPTVIYEAAACGLPVIASDIGGTKELVDYFGGYVFAAGDVVDLSAKMKIVFQDIDSLKSVGKDARLKARNLSSSNYTRTIGALLDRV